MKKLVLISIHMQENNLITQSLPELLEFQESWNLIGQVKVRLANKNQVEKVNQLVGFKSV